MAFLFRVWGRLSVWPEITQLGKAGEPGLEPSLSGSRLTGSSSLQHHAGTPQAILSQTRTPLQEIQGSETTTFPAALGEEGQKFAGDFRIKLHSLDPGGKHGSQVGNIFAVEGNGLWARTWGAQDASGNSAQSVYAKFSAYT